MDAPPPPIVIFVVPKVKRDIFSELFTGLGPTVKEFKAFPPEEQEEKKPRTKYDYSRFIQPNKEINIVSYRQKRKWRK